MITIEPATLEALKAIEPLVAEITQEHEASQNLWMPSEMIPEDHTFTDEFPPEIAGMLVLNLLTEDGLPYFTEAICKHLGDEGAFYDWTRLWTAEENRHGDIIKMYLRGSLSSAQMIAIENLEYQYMRTGFKPDFHNDPFQMIAYVVIQEYATLLSHGGIAGASKTVDPVLQKLMSSVAAEEKRHHGVYLRFFEALMEIDASHAVLALQTALRTFKMPGNGVKNFDDLAILQSKLNVFGPKQLGMIVQRVWNALDIGSLSNLSDHADLARSKIHRRIKSLKRAAEQLANADKETVHLPFLGQGVTVKV